MTDTMLMATEPTLTTSNAEEEYKNKFYTNNKYNYDYDNDYDNYNNNNINDFIQTKTPAKRRGSSKHSTTTTIDTTTTAVDGDADAANINDNEEFANLLSLQLRKPKHWRWELSTSRSCANIALPRILLYDHKGELLIDVNSQVEQCFSQPQVEIPENMKIHQRTLSSEDKSAVRKQKRTAKAATTNLANSIRKAFDRQFSGLQIQEATPSPVDSKCMSNATTPTTDHNNSTTPLSSAVDFYTNDLPEYQLKRRSNSFKGVRFKVNDANDANKNNNQSTFNLADLPTPPSTITTTTTPTHSSSSGPREKRRYRRSHSSARSPATSESILERFSFNKGRFSSPEFAEEHEVYQAPRYYLRTSKAGTLMLQHESFSRYRRRRRLRNSFTENLQSFAGSGSKSSLKISDNEKRSQSNNSMAKEAAVGAAAGELSCDSLGNLSELQHRLQRKKVHAARRHRSDGNVLLHSRDVMSSDEDQMRAMEIEKMKRAPRKYGNHSKKPSKRELIIIDPENDVQPGAVCSESR